MGCSRKIEINFPSPYDEFEEEEEEDDNEDGFIDVVVEYIETFEGLYFHVNCHAEFYSDVSCKFHCDILYRVSPQSVNDFLNEERAFGPEKSVIKECHLCGDECFEIS